MTSLEAITDLIAANLEIAAPIVALAVAWLLYGVLGKRFLGADDDFWPAIRNRLLPLLDRLGATSGLYATRTQSPNEYVGRLGMELDDVERDLEAMDYYRNPLAALKTSSKGWRSDGSWARRYGRIRGLGTLLRGFDQPISGLPVRFLGRFLQASGDVFATRQVHVTLYERQTQHGTWVYLFAHDEPNSLNPLTAWKHYVGKTQDHERGVQAVLDDLADAGLDVHNATRA